MSILTVTLHQLNYFRCFYKEKLTAVELSEVIVKDCLKIYALHRSQRKKKCTMLCLHKKKDFLKKSGDSVTFQKRAISCVAWLEKKRRKPVLIASTITDPKRPPVTVSRKQNNGIVNDVPCPQSVKEYNEKMGGVDRNDAFRVEYPTARTSRRWW